MTVGVGVLWAVSYRTERLGRAGSAGAAPGELIGTVGLRCLIKFSCLSAVMAGLRQSGKKRVKKYWSAGQQPHTGAV